MNVPIAAEVLFHLGSFPVTNAQINSTIAAVLFMIVAALIGRRITEIPGKLQNGMEMIIEALLEFFDQVTHDRERSKRFLPFVGTMFLFILVSNWMGLMPGTGSIGVWLLHHGGVELIPILRPAASDLNLTVALAIISVIVSHIFGVVALGFFAHFNKFIQVGTIWKALKTFNPIAILTAFVEFIVGIIELVSEISKVLSLSLRLFGNIFAGEVLITVISHLVAYVVPLPFMALEIVVGAVQATVFATLTLVYLTVSTDKLHHDDDAAAEHAHGSPMASHAG